MSLRRSTALLEACCSNGLVWTELHGYRWFKSTLLPAIKALGDATPSPKRDSLLARADYLYLLGDLYFVLHAPRACLMAYLRALQFCGEDVELLGEIADVLYLMGRYRESHTYAERCRHAAMETGVPISAASVSCETEMTPGPPVYAPGDPFWEACERLVS